MLGDSLFPSDRWRRVGATDDEVAYLESWHDQLVDSAFGTPLITSASYSDWDLQQQLDDWRTEGVFPPAGTTAEAEPEEAPAEETKPAKAAAKT